MQCRNIHGSGLQPNMRDRRPAANRDLTIGFGNEPNPDANGRGGPSEQKKSRGVASLVLGVPIPDHVKGPPNPGRTKITQERVQPRAVNRERRVAVGGLDAGAHPLERRDHAPHGTPRERRVPDQTARERVAGQDAGKQPHRRPRVARIERLGRGTKPAQASSVYSNGICAFDDLDAQTTDTRKGRPAVGSRRVSGEIRSALGERGQ